MIVEIEESAIDIIKNEAETINKGKEFNEFGGYLIGLFDGNRITVKNFHLDKYSDSTSTRIKLSTEAFNEIEEIIAKDPQLIHVGTWHVHPGDKEPFYSQTDLSTLFLEKLRITTDNPVNVDTPLIHVIFNQDMSLYNCFTLNVNANLKSVNLNEPLGTSFLNRTFYDDSSELLHGLKEILNETMTTEDIELAMTNCEEIEDNMEDLRIQLRIMHEVQSYNTYYNENLKDITKKITTFIKETEKIGIIYIDKDSKLQVKAYRPKNIKETYKNESLLGFFIQLPFNSITNYLEQVFIFNFLQKLSNPESEPYIHVQITNENALNPKFFYLESFEEIFYEKIETKLI